jgi:hypothetical protein
MPEITFSEEYHQYFVDGEKIPISVTGLLKRAGLIDDTFFTEYGRLRGKLTHVAIAYCNTGTLEEDSLDDVLKPFFKGYVSFLTDSGFVVTASEQILYSKEMGLAGTLDLEGYFKRSPNILYIGDVKTGAMQDWTRLQTALYALLRGGYRRRFGVELKHNGKYKLKVFTDQSDYTVVRQLLKEVSHGTNS